VRDHGGRLEMPGATQDVIRTIPRFDYATDTALRDHFVAAAVEDIGRARRNLGALQKAAGATEAEARVKLQPEIDQLQRDLQVAEGKPWREAVINAAAVRAQPIALTALAAMLGALFILDDPIFNGLAISLIFGIAVSTLLTLVVIPLLYFAWLRRRPRTA
jgi:hypothetical protein